MRWLRNIVRPRAEETEAAIRFLQGKFQDFLTILDRNNETLRTISDMEEKSQGQYLLDINYITSSLERIRGGVRDIIERLISLGGDGYAVLRDRLAAINTEIDNLLPGACTITEDDLTIPFERLSGQRAHSVGSKSAQLGQIRALGLPVPEGFAISAWAYKRFLDANGLQARISARLGSVDIKSYAELVNVSREIQGMVASSAIPDEVVQAIRRAAADLKHRTGATRFALRSSAIGEDTQFSFAGQYASFLNVGEDEIIERYRAVLASKFSPKAIYYLLSHDLAEAEQAMGVACMVLVNAKASGVTYTRDPVNPNDDSILVHSIFGLGTYLVEGRETPDVYRLRREDGAVVDCRIASKPVRLVPGPDGGTVEEPMPESERDQPSVTERHLKLLAGYARALEDHYGVPQDIEWAIDYDERLLLLQSRPLRVMRTKVGDAAVDVSSFEALVCGGTTVCPGAGGGGVWHAESTDDLSDVPERAVLVAPHPFAGLVTAMGKASALVIEHGGVASHMATIAREYRVPTLVGVENAGRLPAGEPVTVDATNATIYAGVHEGLIAARRPDFELFEDTEIFRLLERVLARIAPLNLVEPTSPEFTPEKCRTLHDITRFAHQRAIEEMFLTGRQMAHKKQIGMTLLSEIPLPVRVVNIDGEAASQVGRRSLREDAIDSIPMQAFWAGVRQEPWVKPLGLSAPDRPGSPMATTMTRSSSDSLPETSFAILGKEYMIVSLYLGYHFTTVEAMCSADASRNYIRLQHKDGGASLERRRRRVDLVAGILSNLGFECMSRGDYLEASLAYQPAEAIAEKLSLLGRLTIMTRQLDMALSNDSLTDWYGKDFARKLGLRPAGEPES